MTKINHPNLGEITGTKFVTGVVTEVYSADDTVDITVAGVSYPKVPLFYHCTPTAVQRSNGAMTDAAKAFHTDDVVIAQLLDGVVLRVVGFQSGLKPCISECPCAEDTEATLVGDWKTINLSAYYSVGMFPANQFTLTNPNEDDPGKSIVITSDALDQIMYSCGLSFSTGISSTKECLFSMKYHHTITGFQFSGGSGYTIGGTHYDTYNQSIISLTSHLGAAMMFWRYATSGVRESWVDPDCGSVIHEEGCICFVVGAGGNSPFRINIFGGGVMHASCFTKWSSFKLGLSECRITEITPGSALAEYCEDTDNEIWLNCV